jgi:uncharacterized alpha-E superfamily protein
MDLLLADDGNPRSLLFQLQALAAHLESLPRLIDSPFPGRERREVLRGISEIQLFDFPALARDWDGESATSLHALLTHLKNGFPVISDALTRAWLSHAETTRQLARGNA